MSTFGGQGKLQSTVRGLYRKENKTILLLKLVSKAHYDGPLLGYTVRKNVMARKVKYDRKSIILFE